MGRLVHFDPFQIGTPQQPDFQWLEFGGIVSKFSGGEMLVVLGGPSHH